MTIKFCGAAREVTGSCHLITLDSGFTILLDCGLYQGHDHAFEDFNNKWLFDPSTLNCLVLSHAHIDHTGRIPKLVKDGFTGKIHSTHATRSLSNLMLLDSAMIQEREAQYQNHDKSGQSEDEQSDAPLYTTEDVKNTIELFCSYPYNEWFPIHENVEVQFRDAGHILGSANVTLRIQENGVTKMLGFTGDIGRPNRPILRDPQPMPEVEFLISESTYGDREHQSAPEETEHFTKIILDTCVERKGKLLIPAFSVGRTQEIVFILDKLASAGKLPHIPVYVDSPLAVNATMVFGSHPECFDEDLSSYILTDPNPFGFNGLHYIQKVEDSKALAESHVPCIIISSSGMINAGRIKHHVFNEIDKPNNTLLIVGYCSPETPCGRLRQGVDHIKLFGQTKAVRAKIETMDSFSAHGDRKEMLAFLQNQKNSAKRIFLVHGDYKVQQSYADLLLKDGFAQVDIPTLGEEVKL